MSKHDTWSDIHTHVIMHAHMDNTHTHFYLAAVEDVGERRRT